MQSCLEMKAQQPNLSRKQNCKSVPVIHPVWEKAFYDPIQGLFGTVVPADWELSSPGKTAAAWRLLLTSMWKRNSWATEMHQSMQERSWSHRRGKKNMEVDTYLQIWLMFLLLWIAMQRDFLLWKQHGCEQRRSLGSWESIQGFCNLCCGRLCSVYCLLYYLTAEWSLALLTDKNRSPLSRVGLIFCCYTAVHLQILTHGVKWKKLRHTKHHIHMNHPNGWGWEKFFTFLKLKAYTSKKMHSIKCTVYSLEVKGRCQRDFHLLGISLRSIHNIAMKSGEANTVVIFK